MPDSFPPSSPQPKTIAIVAALKRELWPLVRSWSRRDLDHNGHQYGLFESERTVAVCAGMGAEAGRVAAQALLDIFHPKILISGGFAGSLIAELKVGSTLLASRVFDAATGQSWPAMRGSLPLVSAESILGSVEKRLLRDRFGACAVDMEAAAVAGIAAQAGTPFLAVKSISDELDFPMPPLQRFVRPDGSFSKFAFARYVLARPALWPVVIRLARNSAKAAETLALALLQLIDHPDFHSSAIESKLAQTEP